MGRNKDRQDAKNLPEDRLELVEIEPLRQKEIESEEWTPDELATPAFVNLTDCKLINVEAFHKNLDVWVVKEPLSEGCGGPELPEEVML